MLIARKRIDQVNKFKAQLSSEFEMTDLGDGRES